VGADDALLVVIKVMNKLKKEGVVLDYAIYGDMAVMKYTELVFTTGLDIIVSFEQSPLINLTPIYDEFKKLGYQRKVQHIIVEDFPVEFMVADELELEAIENANIVSVGGIKTKILKPEYLIALSVKAGRTKDRMKIDLLLSQVTIDVTKLKDVLVRYSLESNFDGIYKWPER